MKKYAVCNLGTNINGIYILIKYNNMLSKYVSGEKYNIFKKNKILAYGASDLVQINKNYKFIMFNNLRFLPCIVKRYNGKWRFTDSYSTNKFYPMCSNASDTYLKEFKNNKEALIWFKANFPNVKKERIIL